MSNTLSQSPAPVRDVLYEFALTKTVPDAELLDEFVRRYPEYAGELTEFAIEVVVDSLRGHDVADTAIDVTNVTPAVSRAMSTFQNAIYANRATKSAVAIQNSTGAVSVENPFAKLDRQDFRQLSKDLNANSVFVCKLRDRQIESKTMSPGFVKFLAAKVKVLPDVLEAFFRGRSSTVLQPQFYKAEQKADGGLQQSFEDAVRSSGLTEEQQRHLLSL